MVRQRLSLLLTNALILGTFSGCCGRAGTRSGYLSTPRVGVAPTCDRCAVGGPQPPRFNPTRLPIVPGPPIPATVSPPTPAAVSPPPAGEIQQNAFVPPGQPNPAPPAAGSPGVYLSAPEPAATPPAQPMPNEPAPSRDATRLYPPQTTEPPTAPPAKGDRSATPAMPVDIPQFSVVKTDVAYGHEPFAEGIRWLKTHGYRAVLHLRSPGEDDKEAQAQFEKQGLRYLSLEVAPQTLAREIVDQFNRLVSDPANRPLFVYDRDSTLAGGLWYLHFRLVDKQADDKARAAVSQLGFKEDQDSSHRTMWIAVQNYLQGVKP